MDQNYTEINARTIDQWVSEGWEWGVPISQETFQEALQGRWDVLLTPQISVPKEWFAPYLQEGRLDGVKLLGLASGGGQQMPVFSALGAQCTVLDYSQSQLESERLVAEREGYEIDIVKADMTKPLPFTDACFDIIFHPVSNCYVEDVYPLWRECFRVLKKGGLLLAGLDNGLSYLFDEESSQPLALANKLPYNPLKNPQLLQQALASNSGVQFSHTVEEQVGGQLLAGFTLTNLREDRAPGDPLGEYFPQFMLTRAIRP